MRAVVQRVTRASVKIDQAVKSGISEGLLVLLGIETADTPDDAKWLAGKISRLRIFDDDQGVMNKSVTDAGGEVLVVSQFTLHAGTRKGNRPSYIKAAGPELAIPLYQSFIKYLLAETGKQPATGEFGAMMDVELVNNGPVTIIMDTKNKE